MIKLGFGTFLAWDDYIKLRLEVGQSLKNKPIMEGVTYDQIKATIDNVLRSLNIQVYTEDGELWL